MWYYRAFSSLPRRMSNRKSRRSKSSSWAETQHSICTCLLASARQNDPKSGLAFSNPILSRCAKPTSPTSPTLCALLNVPGPPLRDEMRCQPVRGPGNKRHTNVGPAECNPCKQSRQSTLASQLQGHGKGSWHSKLVRPARCLALRVPSSCTVRSSVIRSSQPSLGHRNQPFF